MTRKVWFIYIKVKYIYAVPIPVHAPPARDRTLPTGMSSRGPIMPALTPLTYQILLALADHDRHGYGIIKEIEARAGAASAPSSGALYLALQRMETEGLVAEAARRPAGADDDARRRYYRLTARGRALAEGESERLAGLVATAREKKLLPEGTA